MTVEYLTKHILHFKDIFFVFPTVNVLRFVRWAVTSAERDAAFLAVGNQEVQIPDSFPRNKEVFCTSACRAKRYHLCHIIRGPKSTFLAI